MTKFLILATFLLFSPAASAAPAAAPQTLHALAMTGSPAYPADFDHFSYANPKAPKGGSLKLGATGSFDSLNPFIVRGQTPFGLSPSSMALVYESLMARGWDEPFTLYPLLAESVEMAEDRSSITFILNKAARFSDDTPVTADDVAFSFETLRDKGRPHHRTYYKKVALMEKLSPTRIRFTFKRGEKGVIDREMPLIMGLMPIFPRHDWVDRDFNQTTTRVPVGSGPYKVAAVDLEHSVTYERNTNYWGQNIPSQRGLYNFGKIRIDYYRDESIALEAFKSGQYDLKRETDPNRWINAYESPALAKARFRQEHLEHHRTEPAYGFIFNTRRAFLSAPVLRAAMQYSIDFDWVNTNLFYGQYKRVDSFFPNSELAATGLPEGKELEILEAYRERLPEAVFTTPTTPPDSSTQGAFRANLLKAEKMLREAGYKVENDQLYTPEGKAVTFEILLSDPAEERVAVNWTRGLKRLGITARVRTVDSAQYQSRLAAFDFDVTANKWANSLSPGNEQMYFWSAAAADQKGSRNYAGVKDPVVDALAAAIPNATTREDLVAATHALDRVLMQGHYFLPLFYLGADNIASWAKLHHPTPLPLYGNVMESWWE